MSEYLMVGSVRAHDKGLLKNDSLLAITDQL